jgi:hypothetical protein
MFLLSEKGMMIDPHVKYLDSFKITCATGAILEALNALAYSHPYRCTHHQ